MKAKFYLIIVIFVCLYSCKSQIFDETFGSVIIYYYGHSGAGVTYDVPVKFFFNKKEIATFHLYSRSLDLESGVYNYSNELVGTQLSFIEVIGENKTFFKGDCKWGDNVITSGTVTVDRQGDKYTFIVDVTDNKGEHHYGKFSGKVKKEDWYTKSTLGLFNGTTIWESEIQVGDDYKATAIQLDAGYYAYTGAITLSVGFRIIRPKNDKVFEGVYRIGESNMDGEWCSYKNYPEGKTHSIIELTTGTITITKVNEPWRYKIDVDAVAKNGYEIKGSFTGNYMHFSFGYDPEN